YGTEQSNFPLALNVDDVGDGFLLMSQVEAPIAPMRVCAYMHTALSSLTDALETESARAVRTLEVLPKEERDRLIWEWNATATEGRRDRCVHELVEAQASATPDRVAVVFQDAALSYG